MKEVLLSRVHRADADLPNAPRRDRRRLARCQTQADQLGRALTAQVSQGHAVQVAAGRELIRVEVRMGVQPQHVQLAVRCTAMPSHRADAADRQGMVAAQQHGQAALLQLTQDRLVNGPVPGRDLLQVAVAIRWRLPGVGRPDQVAAVEHFQPVAFESLHQACHPKRLRTHAGAARAGPDVGRCADQADARPPGCRGHARSGVSFRFTVGCSCRYGGVCGWRPAQRPRPQHPADAATMPEPS